MVVLILRTTTTNYCLPTIALKEHQTAMILTVALLKFLVGKWLSFTLFAISE